MTATIIDGKYVAALYREEIKQLVTNMIEQGQRAPGLAVILIGNNSASEVYVRSKIKACNEVSFLSFTHHLPLETTETQLLALIKSLNDNAAIDGILVQLPLPDHIDTKTVIEHINPLKDVDGFHPYNLGRLACGNPLLRPCTPYGIMKLFEHYQIPVTAKHVVVVGASNIVGRPMALELLLAKATVTVCHSKTKNLDEFVRIADIIIVATGKRGIINPEWLNKHQTVIDVGIHRLPNGELCGDIDFNIAKNKVAYITPVPFGVGPMTIAMLLHNTSYSRSLQSKSSSNSPS